MQIERNRKEKSIISDQTTVLKYVIYPDLRCYNYPFISLLTFL